MLEEGLEPSRSFEQKILSLLCLPIPPPELKLINDFKERGEASPLLIYYIMFGRPFTRIAATRPGASS